MDLIFQLAYACGVMAKILRQFLAMATSRSPPTTWRPTAEATHAPRDGDGVDAGAPWRPGIGKCICIHVQAHGVVQSASVILIWRL